MQTNNKLREALKEARVAIESAKKKMGVENSIILEIIDAALASPPRNCDRFNSGDCNKDVFDASLAWDKFCAEHYPPGTPVVPKTPYTFWSWVFAPAKEGGAK